MTPDGAGGVRMTALAPIPKGAPVQLNYGALSNDFLLLDYGFVARDNPHDFISLRFDESLLLNACMVRTVEAQSPYLYHSSDSSIAAPHKPLLPIDL